MNELARVSFPRCWRVSNLRLVGLRNTLITLVTVSNLPFCQGVGMKFRRSRGERELLSERGGHKD